MLEGGPRARLEGRQCLSYVVGREGNQFKEISFIKTKC